MAVAEKALGPVTSRVTSPAGPLLDRILITIVLIALAGLYAHLALTDLTRIPRVNLDEPWLMERGYYVLRDGLPRQRAEHETVYWLQVGYPYLLGLWYWLTDTTSVYSSRLLSVFAGAGIVALTFLLGRRLHSVAAGVIAALLLVTDSHLLGQARMARPEAVSVFLALLALLVFLHALDRNNARLGVLAGILGGYAVLCHANALWGAFVALVWYVLTVRRRFFHSKVGWAYGLSLMGVLGAYTAVLLLHWDDAYRQLSWNSSRLVRPSADAIINNILSELPKYKDWYFGLITDLTPNPIVIVFQWLTIGSYCFVLAYAAIFWRTIRADRNWLRLLAFVVVIPVVMAVVVVNKSHTYIINSLPAFAILCGVAVTEASWLAKVALQRWTEIRVPRSAAYAMLLVVVLATSAFAAATYEDWFRRMRTQLATYEQTTGDILALLPEAPTTVVANFAFLLPHLRTDIAFVSAGILVQEVGLPPPKWLPPKWKVNRMADPDTPLYVLWDADTFGIDPALSRTSLAYVWRKVALDYIANYCSLVRRAFTINWGQLKLYRCARVGGEKPPPVEPELVFGGHRFRQATTLRQFGPLELSDWRAYKADQQVDFESAWLRLRGKNGGGIYHDFKASELGLKPGDYIVFSIEVPDAPATVLTSVSGDIVTTLGQLDSNQPATGWHSLRTQLAGEKAILVIGRILGENFRVYIYSESPVDMRIVSFEISALRQKSDRGS